MQTSSSPPPFVEALTSPECYDHPVEQVRLVETHISWVFLTGELAYKVKKPLKLPFLDFSTLERRRYFCEEELRLNRRLAEELYLDVVPIGGEPAAPRIGRQPAFEYAVKMRQFPDSARLDRRLEAGDLPAAALLDFAEALARFHAALPPLEVEPPEPGRGSAIVAGALRNLVELEEWLRGADQRRSFAELRSWTERQCAAIEPILAERAASGAHRECHGDLHLENLLISAGRIVAFDALEFDPKLREIDVISEASFLAMDLLAHRRADLAYGFLNRYLEVCGDYAGIGVLRFYLVDRALVRAKVRAIKAAQTVSTADDDELLPYLAVAGELTRPREPLLLITHGLSGSGKTYVSSELVARLPALRVRSDLERKRLHGLAPSARTKSPIGGGLYAADVSAATYERLASIADRALANGFDVIVDATFLAAGERERFRRLAAARRARFAVLDCVAPEAVLRGRIDARDAAARDASEATRGVLDYQLAHQEPLTRAEQAVTVTVATDAPIDHEALARQLRPR
jgi:aminoglycoside phosphotransferase family enzyme/predicted kinase